MDHLEEWLGQQVDDAYSIPLSFLLREEPKPTYVEKDYVSLRNEYAECCPHVMSNGTTDVKVKWYASANEKLWTLLHSIFVNHPSYAYVSAFRRKKDGHAAYFSLKKHHLGEDAVSTMASALEAQLASLSYTNEGRRWNFEKYVTKHVELYNQSENLKRFGYHGLDDRSRVRKLLAGIKTNKFDSLRAHVLSTPTLKKNFDGVVALYHDFISEDKSTPGGRVSSQIAAVGGRGNQRKSGGDDGGRRRKGKRDNGQISQVTVTDRYYSREEYAKLSNEEKMALRNLRLGRKRQRGNDGSAKTAALKVESDDEDDNTVTASNGGTSNRSNPALVRQGRPKKNG
jgi:hypothetical protein